MDINEVRDENEDEGVVVHLKDRSENLMYDDDGRPLTMRVAGRYSQRYRDADRKHTDASLKRSWNRLSRNKPPTTDELNTIALEKQAACIVEWPFTAAGVPFPITAANWAALLKKQGQWQEQVQKAIDEYADFLSTG